MQFGYMARRTAEDGKVCLGVRRCPRSANPPPPRPLLLPRGTPWMPRPQLPPHPLGLAPELLFRRAAGAGRRVARWARWMARRAWVAARAWPGAVDGPARARR